MKQNINMLKIVSVIIPVIVILTIYLADINSYFVKPLLAGSVMILCSLQFHLLNKLYKDSRK